MRIRKKGSHNVLVRRYEKKTYKVIKSITVYDSDDATIIKTIQDAIKAKEKDNNHS